MMDYVLCGAWHDGPSFQRYLSARTDRFMAQGIDVDIWRRAVSSTSIGKSRKPFGHCIDEFGLHVAEVVLGTGDDPLDRV